MAEQRKNKRMNLECKLLLKRLDQEDSNAREVDVIVKDVSKSGIGFSCDEILTNGSVYECLLTIWTKETLHTFVEIIRVIPKPGEFFYGGIFIGMSEQDKSRIEIYSEFSDLDENT
ncbi:MAG: PilZ domain-containing protein [Lachnospiraceae bacterium]|nr:PilZ domain-containing protein [Lachnospiraceae bacterium]